MEKIQAISKVFTSVSLIIFINLGACDNIKTVNDLPHDLRIKNSENVGFIVIGNNSETIAKNRKQRGSAKTYRQKLEAAADEIKTVKEWPTGPNQPVQHEKIAALTDERIAVGMAVLCPGTDPQPPLCIILASNVSAGKEIYHEKIRSFP